MAYVHGNFTFHAFLPFHLFNNRRPTGTSSIVYVDLPQILAFVTGADCIPPLGFDINRAVLFSTDRSRLLPVAFTCALTHENVSH